MAVDHHLVHDSRTNGWKRHETLVFKPIEFKRLLGKINQFIG